MNEISAPNIWLDSAEEKARVMGELVGAFRSVGYIANLGCAWQDDLSFTYLLKKLGIRPAEFDSGAEYMAAVMMKASGALAGEFDALDTETLTCTLSKSYAGISVTFGITAQFAVDNDLHRSAIMQQLSHKVTLEHAQWLARAMTSPSSAPAFDGKPANPAGAAAMNAETSRPAPAPMGYREQDGVSYEIVPITAITCDFEKGKWLYKVRGGQYQQFGVPLYDEYAIQFGLVPSAENKDAHIAFNGVAVIQVNAQKKRKVVELRKS